MLSIRPWIPRSRRERREAGARILRKKRLVKPKDQKQTARIFRNWLGRFGTRTIFAILKKWDVDEET